MSPDLTAKRPGKRIQDIELLRALAVLSVVLHHAKGNLFTWNLPWLNAFFQRFDLWWGVDLFFAISGFVIARDLLPRLQRCSSHTEHWRMTLAFWTRRAFRLLPSAWLWLLLILLACRFLNTSGAFGSLQANLAATGAAVLQLANFRFAESFGNYEYGTSFVYWSLSLEEQFYLLLPLLALLTRRWMPWLLVLLVIVQFFTWRTPLLMSVRTDAIALGVLLALWSDTRSYAALTPRAAFKPLLLIGVAALIFGLMEFSTNHYLWTTYRIGVIALLSATLVWLASYNRDILAMPAQPLQQLMLWVGSRSYGIYLIHIPAFCLTREVCHRLYSAAAQDGSHTLLVTLLAGLLVAGLSELNYRYIEMPLRTRGSRVAARLMERPSTHDATAPAPGKTI